MLYLFDYVLLLVSVWSHWLWVTGVAMDLRCYVSIEFGISCLKPISQVWCSFSTEISWVCFPLHFPWVFLWSGEVSSLHCATQGHSLFFSSSITRSTSTSAFLLYQQYLRIWVAYGTSRDSPFCLMWSGTIIDSMWKLCCEGKWGENDVFRLACLEETTLCGRWCCGSVEMRIKSN